MDDKNYQRFVTFKFLQSIDRLGPARILNLISKFHSIENLLGASEKEISQVDSISRTLTLNILKEKHNFNDIASSAEKDYHQVSKLGGRVLCYGDENYPLLLKNIYSPPLILYTFGEITDLTEHKIAIVGTRLPTNYGKSETENLTKQLVEQNVTIVSGMARGIDTIAHKTSLKYSGKTVAVVGSGLDVIYPPENKKLFEQIKGEGLIVSEFELGTKPDAQNFPQRNRIISGLSLGTVIIETKLNGGAMQTAAYALDQNREVFALPGNINSLQSEGTNALIQKGEAKLITNAEDVLVELNLKIKPSIGENIPPPKVDLNFFEQKILDALSNDPKHIDKLADEISISSSECLVSLLSLEFKGLVTQLPGKNFKLSY